METSFQKWLWLNEVRVIFEHSNVRGMTWKQFQPLAVKALDTGRWDEGSIRDFVGGDSLLARFMRAGVQSTTLLGIMHHDPSLAPVMLAPMAAIQKAIGHDDHSPTHHDVPHAAHPAPGSKEEGEIETSDGRSYKPLAAGGPDPEPPPPPPPNPWWKEDDDEDDEDEEDELSNW